MKQEGGGLFREGTPYQRRGSLQLWQFLVALLDDPGNAHFIAWTGRGMEFKLIEPEEVSLNCKRPFFSSIKDGGEALSVGAIIDQASHHDVTHWSYYFNPIW